MKPFQILSNEFDYDITRQIKRGITIQAHISDIHFGVMDPKVEFDILKDQFVDVIKDLPLDCISIDGDLFDKLAMSNTDTILYANLFFRELYNICKNNKSKGLHTVLLLLMGTKNHDADQLRLFYPYLNDPDVDVRIVEQIQFEIINGCKVLCIPELYKVDEEIYTHYLHKCGLYDMVFLHGTIEGAVYDNSSDKNYRIFNTADFSNCLGCVIAGHVHPGGSYLGFCYYNGSPVRWAFGEEQTKGFQIVLYDMDSKYSYVYKQPITSFKYETIFIDDLLYTDPQIAIDYINDLKQKEKIDYIRLKCISRSEIESNLNIIKEYFRNDKTVKFKIEKENSPDQKSFDQKTKELYDQYSYFFDNAMTPYEKFARYVNESQSDIMVSADQIINILKEI